MGKKQKKGLHGGEFFNIQFVKIVDALGLEHKEIAAGMESKHSRKFNKGNFSKYYNGWLSVPKSYVNDLYIAYQSRMTELGYKFEEPPLKTLQEMDVRYGVSSDDAKKIMEKMDNDKKELWDRLDIEKRERDEKLDFIISQFKSKDDPNKENDDDSMIVPASDRE